MLSRSDDVCKIKVLISLTDMFQFIIAVSVVFNIPTVASGQTLFGSSSYEGTTTWNIATILVATVW